MGVNRAAFDHPRFARYGSPLDLDDFEHDELEFLRLLDNQIFVLIAARCRCEGVEPPVFAFTLGDRLEAFAGINPPFQVIGMTIAKALTVRRYFQAALSFPGTMYTEQLGAFSAPPTLADPTDIRQYMHEHMPTDAKILGIAEGLARYALLYVAMHELGHLNMGHTASRAEGEVAHWDEDEEASKSHANRDSLAMELVADLYAADVLALYIADQARTAIPVRFLFQCAGVGLDSMFHLERRVGAWAQGFSSSTHPPMQFRAISAIVRLGMALETNGLITQAQMLDTFGGAMELTLRLYETLTGVQRNPAEGEPYAQMLGESGALALELLHHHRELFPHANI